MMLISNIVGCRIHVESCSSYSEFIMHFTLLLTPSFWVAKCTIGTSPDPLSFATGLASKTMDNML